MRFILTLLIGIIVGLYSGCSRLKIEPMKTAKNRPKVFSCQEEAKPKSLQFLEQQYRCRSQK